MTTPTDVLRESLERHNAKFESLLRLIPPEFYIEREPDTEQSKYQRNTKGVAPKQAIKEATKKAKRLKLDPANNKSVLELQQETAAPPKAPPSRKGKEKAIPQDEATDPEHETRSDEDDESGVDGGDLMEQGPVPLRPLPKPESISDLRAKLKARIAELRHGRNKTSLSSGSPMSKDDLLEEQRRAHARGEREERKQKPYRPSSQLIVPPVRKPRTDQPNQVRPKAPSFANVQFSTIGKGGKFKSRLASDPKTAIKQLETKAQKLSNLPDDRRQAIQVKEKWQKAEMLLEGEKVKDDVMKLKKAMKKKEKEKAKSKAKWDERKRALQNDMEAKQKKRADNIAMRHDRKKNKSRPGFEGGKSFGSGVGRTKKPKRSKA
ncbi:hypothetical protein FRB99_000393 [Tulasnella sp. 403]|nr:hypothetical protein FRB99_000393 [Tulasnella sp. 403]